MIYNGKHFAYSFRTVRKNTIQIAEDIPEDKYTFKPTPDSRSVAEELAHVAAMTAWYQQAHAIDKVTAFQMQDFGKYMALAGEIEKQLTTKDKIVEKLRSSGEEFARYLENVTDQILAEDVTFPPGAPAPSKKRFEMLLGAKEHEMHHRAKLMVIQRLLGIVPHLTREREQRMAAMAATKA